MSTLTLVNILLTIAVYAGALALAKRIISPLTTPVLTATIIIIAIFSMADISYAQYEPAKEWMTYLLGPATVALAVPLYKNLGIIMEKLLPAAIGLGVGTLSTIASAWFISKAFGLSQSIQTASTVKAVTTPVAIETAILIGGSPSLTVAFVITAGIVGAVFGPIILNLVKVTDPFARGFGIGTVSHGIGTSQALAEGPVTGAASSVAMGSAAIFTSLLLPIIYSIFDV